MKKVYQTPETKAVLLLSANAIMAASITPVFDLYDGTGVPGSID